MEQVSIPASVLSPAVAPTFTSEGYALSDLQELDTEAVPPDNVCGPADGCPTAAAARTVKPMRGSKAMDPSNLRRQPAMSKALQAPRTPGHRSETKLRSPRSTETSPGVVVEVSEQSCTRGRPRGRSVPRHGSCSPDRTRLMCSALQYSDIAGSTVALRRAFCRSLDRPS